MSRIKPARDPRGHSLRIYSDVYDSPAFASLSPHDVLAYLALLRELKGFNNGDLSLPLSRAKKCGIGHHITLARSLRALCAVGLVALTRRGGCTKGGQRLASLYRLTDRECYAIPAKHLEAMRETHDWKRITTVGQGLQLIEAAEKAVKDTTSKTKALGHGVTRTTSSGVVVSSKTRTSGDTWTEQPGHRVTMAKHLSNLASMRVPAPFSSEVEKEGHRTPRVPPMYLCQATGNVACLHEHGPYRRLKAKPSRMLSRLVDVPMASIEAVEGVSA